MELKRLRERRLMTQEELARAANVTPGTISLIENGHVRPQFSTIKRLARALDVPAEELVELRDLVAQAS